MAERWLFEVIQDGMIVAGGETLDQDSAIREAGHYVMMYGQDGECTAIVRKPGDKKALIARNRVIKSQPQR